MIMKRLLLSFCLCHFLLFFGQQYSSFWYNTDNGLPQNSIKDIIKDKYGFIWLSTDGGIVRYDGKNFLTYKNLKLSNFNFLYFSGNIKKDSLILPNARGSEYLVITKRKITIHHKDSLAIKDKTYSIKYKNKEYILFNKNNSQSIITYPFKAFIRCKSGIYLLEEGKNIIYIDHTFKTKKNIPIPFYLKNLVNLFGFGDTLFLRDHSKKSIIKLENGEVSHFISDDPLYTDPLSRIYWLQTLNQNFIINKGKIYLSELKDGKLKTSFIIKIKSSDIDMSSISSIYFDKENNLIYIGTVNKGLDIIKLASFSTPELSPAVEYRVQYSMLPFSKDQIINLQGRVYDKKSLVKDYHFNTLDESSMIYDHDKNILFSNNNGRIYRRYANSCYQKYDYLKLTQFPYLILKDGEYCMLTLSDENLSNYYLNIYENDCFEKVNHAFMFKNYINSVKHIDSDQILVGCTDGLYLASKSQQSIKKISTGILDIKKITSTNDGNIWIITRGKGFYLLKSNQLIKMPYDENGYLSYPHEVLKDKKGFLWIPSNNGLFKVPEKKLLEYAINNKTKVFYYRFTKDDGFKINEFNGSGASSSFVELQNGDFVLPSMDGYVFFNPLKVNTYYPKKNDIYIERIKDKTNGSDFTPINDTLHLKNNLQDTSIYIDIPYFSNNDNLHIDAKLQDGDEINTNWESVKDRIYNLNPLPPGDYTLNIRALISPDNHFTYKKISIHIPPLFYQTLWFRIFIIVILISIITLIIISRTRFLKTENDELKKIVQEKNSELKETQDMLKSESEYQKNLIQTINHDITTPIRYLSMMSQKLVETNSPKLQKQYFNMIHKSSEELYKFTLNLKNYTELFNSQTPTFQEEEYYIFNLIEDKKSLFKEIALQNQTVIYNNSEKNIKLQVNKTILMVIIHNLIDNAVKNTYEGEIMISTSTKDSLILIHIIDNGIGMKEQFLDYYNKLNNNHPDTTSSFKTKGLGLHLVIQLLKKLNGNISFEKNQPKGTQVEISIPTLAQ